MFFGGDDDNNNGNSKEPNPVIDPNELGDDMGTKIGEGHDPATDPHAG